MNYEGLLTVLTPLFSYAILLYPAFDNFNIVHRLW